MAGLLGSLGGAYNQTHLLERDLGLKMAHLHDDLGLDLSDDEPDPPEMIKSSLSFPTDGSIHLGVATPFTLSLDNPITATLSSSPAANRSPVSFISSPVLGTQHTSPIPGFASITRTLTPPIPAMPLVNGISAPTSRLTPPVPVGVGLSIGRTPSLTQTSMGLGLPFAPMPAPTTQPAALPGGNLLKGFMADILGPEVGLDADANDDMSHDLSGIDVASLLKAVEDGELHEDDDINVGLAKIAAAAAVDVKKETTTASSEANSSKNGNDVPKNANDISSNGTVSVNSTSSKQDKGKTEATQASTKTETKENAKPSTDSVPVKPAAPATRVVAKPTPVETPALAQGAGKKKGGRPTKDKYLTPPSPELPSKRTTNQLYFLEHTVMKALMKHKDSAPFRDPVDWKGLGLLDYPEVVEKPMDFGCIVRKLQEREYASAEDCLADIRLVFSNCRLYNQPASDIVILCQNLEAVLRQKMEKMPKTERELSRDEEGELWKVAWLKKERDKIRRVKGPKAARGIKRAGAVPKKTKTKKMSGGTGESGKNTREKRPPEDTGSEADSIKRFKTGGAVVFAAPPPRKAATDTKASKMSKYKKPPMGPGLKFCSNVHRELMSKKYCEFAWPFYEPVDPLKQQCPDYLNVIKQPMDLSTVRRKLDDRAYLTPAEFAVDMRLIFRNCIVYNPEDNVFHTMAKQLQDVFEAKFAQLPPELLHVPPPTYQVETSPAPTGAGFEGKSSPVPPPRKRSSSPAQDDDFDSDSEKPRKRRKSKSKGKSKKEKSKKKEKKSKAEKKAKKSKYVDPSSSSSEDESTASSYRPPPTKSKKNPKTNTASPTIPAKKPPVHKYSYSEKQALSQSINKLSGQHIAGILKIIRKHLPNLKDDSEIELDIDTLSDEALADLDTYVKGIAPQPPPQPLQRKPSFTDKKPGVIENKPAKKIGRPPGKPGKVPGRIGRPPKAAKEQSTAQPKPKAPAPVKPDPIKQAVSKRIYSSSESSSSSGSSESSDSESDSSFSD